MVLNYLIGVRLEAIQFDNDPQLLFGENRDIYFRIMREFFIEKDSHKIPVAFIAAQDGDHESPPYGIDTLVDLIIKEVIEAVVDDDGNISITFSDGSLLVVNHGEKYEAWTMTHEGKVLASLPGGGV